jgi:hypothetical protein
MMLWESFHRSIKCAEALGRERQTALSSTIQ